MPVKIRRRGACYEVRTPGGAKAKCTSRHKAERQKRLLNALDHGMTPRRSRR